MLLHHLVALMTPFLRTLIIKSNPSNGGNLPFFFFFSVIAFINEEATDCIIEEAIGAIKEAAIGVIIAPRNLPSYFFT